MKAYCTKNNILVTEKTLKEFKQLVFSIPLRGCRDKRSKYRYYSAIAVFLQHIICSATVSKRTERKSSFKGDDKWTHSVPFPYELGIDVAPEVFRQSRDLPFQRALEEIYKRGIIKIVSKNIYIKKCRQFALSKDFLQKLFPNDRGEYLLQCDRYAYLTNIHGKRSEPKLLEKLIVTARTGQCRAKHHVSERIVKDRVFRDTVKKVYRNMESICINIDALREYCNQHPNIKNMGYYYNFISHIMKVGAELVSEVPFIIKYQQSYKTAMLGGRSFEVGTGYQYLPSEMKRTCLSYGYNYDIKSCQLEILRSELSNLSLSDSNLARLETWYICNNLKIGEESVKEIRFSTIFNCGQVSLSPKSTMYKKLSIKLGEKKAKRVLERWKELMKPLRKDLDVLVDYYLSTGRKNREYGLYVRNAVGQNFNCTYNEDGKRWQTLQMRRKLLAHMIQGLESKAVYDFVISHDGVCALEHDGFVSYRKINITKDWKHPYLRLVLKY